MKGDGNGVSAAALRVVARQVGVWECWKLTKIKTKRKTMKTEVPAGILNSIFVFLFVSGLCLVQLETSFLLKAFMTM